MSQLVPNHLSTLLFFTTTLLKNHSKPEWYGEKWGERCGEEKRCGEGRSVEMVWMSGWLDEKWLEVKMIGRNEIVEKARGEQ